MKLTLPILLIVMLCNSIRGETAPSHCISAILISHDHRTLVTGSHDGQLCVWSMNPETYKVQFFFLSTLIYLYYTDSNLYEGHPKMLARRTHISHSMFSFCQEYS